jgi:MoxR-like ATPase
VTKFVSAKTVVSALHTLAGRKLGRVGRTALMDFLMLKAREPAPGVKFDITSTGKNSVEAELARFFRVAPGTPRPDVNPFGRKSGSIEYFTPGYERRGTFTHLYPGRNLDGIVDVSRAGDIAEVSIPNAAAAQIAEKLKAKIPLRPAAAFMLRNEPFDDGASAADLVARFKTVFHLSDDETDQLFQDEPGFVVEFDTKKFDNSLASLPVDLHPREPDISHATSVAVSTVIPAAPASDVELAISADLRRRVERAVARSKAVALVGPPGTAKSLLWQEILKEAVANPAAIGLENAPSYVRYTAEIDWTARTLIGGYYPQKDGQLVFKEGHLLQAIRHNRLFWIDEMNRADLDRLLGPIFTFLARQDVDLGGTHLGEDTPENPNKQMLLRWVDSDKSEVQELDTQRIYCAGTDWRMIGTYNNVDRGRVFPMGSALLRRWAVVPVPPVDVDTFRALLDQLNVRPPVAELLKAGYRLHLTHLSIGPAPFLDMGRYVVSEGGESSDPAVTPQEHQLLADAYVLYVGQQLARLDPEKREEFFKELGGIFGSGLADEATAL